MKELSHIYNWRRANTHLTTSGQPSEAELGELQALGVTHIVNLGLHDHESALADEANSVQALGMTYIHLPVDFNQPTEVDFENFCQVMEKLDAETIHIHCIANLRVTAFLYRYWRDVAGLVEVEARALMDTVWRPGGVWAAFIGDDASIELPHRPPV